MIFLIETVGKWDIPADGEAAITTTYRWTLCRKEKGEPGEAICRSVEEWPTERQCRAAINTAKKAMGGVRFAQTRVKEVAGDDA